MTTSAFLANNRALIGTCLAPSSGGARVYPNGDTHMYWPGTQSAKNWPSGALNNYNRHKEMWGTRGGPQVVRLYSTSSSNPIDGTSGVTGSAGAYGFISSDWRAIANDGAFLSITFKYGTASTTGMQTIANNLNASTDNATKQAMRQLALNIRRWRDDTGNTATVKKIQLGFHHEPENDPITAASFVAAFRAIVDYLARRGVHDADLSPITAGRVTLDGASAPGGAVASAYDVVEWSHCGMGWQVSDFDYWPGDAYVKWCLMDPYNWGGAQSSANGTGANTGIVPQPGDTAGGNYAKAWNPLKTPVQNQLDWSDAHPDVLLGIGEFGCSEFIDRFTGSNNSTLSNPKVWSAIPGAKGDWFRGCLSLFKGEAYSSTVTSRNTFTADPRAARFKMVCYWNDQAAMPRWINTIPFQSNNTTAPTTAGADRSLTYDGFLDLVEDAWWDELVGGEVTPPTNISLSATVGDTQLERVFTADADAGTGTITTYTFDYGDGTATEDVSTAGPAEASHAYSAEGTYTVTATVTASDGGTASRNLTITVTDGNGGDQPTNETRSGAPLLRTGDSLRQIRFTFNPAVEALAQYAYDRSTKRDISTITGTSYTIDADDIGKLLLFTSATAVTVTIPPNSSEAFPLGSWLDLVQMGAGQVSISEGSGVTLTHPNAAASREQGSRMRLEQLAVDSWLLSGDLETGTPGGGGGGGGGGTTDDYSFDFNDGANGASLSAAEWSNQSGTAATYSTDAVEGTLSAYWNLTSQSSFYRREFGAAETLAWFAFYIKVTALPAASVYLAEWRNGTTKIGDLRLNSAGTLTVRDNSTAIITSSTPLTTGAWHRVAVKIDPGVASTGHTLKTYQAADYNNDTANETYEGSGNATAAGQSGVDRILFGAMTASTIQFRLDRIRINLTEEPSQIGA